MYLKVPASTRSLPPGKSWIAINTAASAGSTGNGMNFSGGVGAASFGNLDGGGVNPADLLASLTAVSGNVTKLGAATVRGVPVTEFRVNVDPAKAARMPGWEGASFREFASSLGNGDLPVDVWVDSQNLVRQMQVSQPVSHSPTTITFVQVVDFYDFGVPVRISAPPAAQVVTESSASGSASGGVSIGSVSYSLGFKGQAGMSPAHVPSPASPAQAVPPNSP
jgi:hypothetical protein